MFIISRLALVLLAAIFALAPLSSRAEETTQSAEVAWRLLDYLSVDYAGAVKDGEIISASEYSEMQEFSASVREKLEALPPTGAQPELISKAKALEAAIARKAPAEEIARSARNLGANLLKAYPTPLAPAVAPDLNRAAMIYALRCAACHGASGHGDGPNAASLDPPPIAFSDADRARQRSVFGLYQVIGQGLDGTAMPSFSDLPSEDRWGLAFYVGQFAFDPTLAEKGRKIWTSDEKLRARFPDLKAVTETTSRDLAADLGKTDADAITAYLRRHPDVIAANHSPLAIARARLGDSLAALDAGDKKRAADLALSAYLDGFESVEPALAARDARLMRRIEAAMGAFRAGVSKGAPSSELRAQAGRINALLDAADRALLPAQANRTASFIAAFTILLREGLEALLIVVAMIAFLRKAERREALAYVHGGWIVALAAGVATWAAATYLVDISGAGRELTEGFGSVIAAIVLVSVGVWMHGKSHAEAWQAYIREKLSKAMSRGSAWFLFLLAFLVVYREVFETILFYVALWSQGGRVAMLLGAASGALALAVIGWLLLSYSKRLPISQFFSYSSVLIAVLAVVLAGKGVAALQEAGLIDIKPLAFVPRIDILGVFPTVQTLLGQAAVLITLVVGFRRAGRKSASQSARTSATAPETPRERAAE